MIAGKVLLTTAAIGFIVIVGRALVIVAGGDPQFLGWDIDDRCRARGYSCGVASSVLMTALTIGFAWAVFRYRRVLAVRRPYLQRAKSQTADVVPTAGTIIGKVVGRDEVCRVIVDDLRHRKNRRPHVIAGGVGVGKTAVLFRLTRMLADRGAVPVAIRLRDANRDLDFNALAKKQFLDQVADASVSTSDAERVWRQLRMDDQIVVLADGLEEALVDDPDGNRNGQPDDDPGTTDRANRIRLAVRKAHRQKLPLVVASRPHDALVGLDAAIIELEQLGADAALEYIEEGASTSDTHRLDWVVERAEVTETPLFLQLAHELHKRGLLEHGHPRHKRFDTRTVDRASLRLRLLDNWTDALIAGRFVPELPLTPEIRKVTVDLLGALACVGLAKDSLEVQFADLLEMDGFGKRYQSVISRLEEDVRRVVESELPGAGDRVKIERELQLAVARGSGLRLVEARGKGVRFPHSILQAYLASRVIDRFITDRTAQRERYLPAALRKAGRELLIALTMYSRSADPPPDPAVLRDVCDELRARVKDPTPSVAKDIDMLVAALEIDCVLPGLSAPEVAAPTGAAASEPPGESAAPDPEAGPDDPPAPPPTPAPPPVVASDHVKIAEELCRLWPQAFEDRTVEEAKLKAVARFGDAARTIADHRQRAPHDQSLAPAYSKLFEIIQNDLSYRVRLAGAQQIGLGGDDALEALPVAEYLQPPDPNQSWEAKHQLGERTIGLPREEAMRLQREEAMRLQRNYTVRAWLGPLLVASSHRHQDDAKENLEAWLRETSRERQQAPHPFPRWLEVALAQGFRHAANQRMQSRPDYAETRFYLFGQASQLLKRAESWYSRIALLHALCLWILPELSEDESLPPVAARWRLLRRRGPAGDVEVSQRRRVDFDALVMHWLGRHPKDLDHPFVGEAAALAVRALETRKPERYLWIDENGVTTTIGARRPRRDAVSRHHQWIPPSVGWSSLHPRAQKLVADMQLLVNLLDGEGGPDRTDERMRKGPSHELPLCLVEYREALRPERTVGMATEVRARCHDGCPFDLCPYPPRGSQPLRAEFSEAFCRRQQVLLSRVRGGRAPWQMSRYGELRGFWRKMEERARR